MKTVNVLLGDSWGVPENFLRQTPGCTGEWDNFRFSQNNDIYTDYAIVVNHSSVHNINAGNVITVIMEPPPVARVGNWQLGHKQSDYVITTDMSFRNNDKFIQSHGALPWLVEATYDELSRLNAAYKNTDYAINELFLIPQRRYTDTVWITSNASGIEGQKNRMRFLNSVKNKFRFSLFGKGFSETCHKLDTLLKYKYSIAIENHSCMNFYTEKVIDCFMTYTLPFYYGCTNLEEYFPEKSFIRIDINDPDESIKIMDDAIKSYEWEKREYYIKEAREIALNKLQFFPYMSQMINRLYE